jgi:hypothetical protein
MNNEKKYLLGLTLAELKQKQMKLVYWSLQKSINLILNFLMKMR